MSAYRGESLLFEARNLNRALSVSDASRHPRIPQEGTGRRAGPGCHGTTLRETKDSMELFLLALAPIYLGCAGSRAATSFVPHAAAVCV